MAWPRSAGVFTVLLLTFVSPRCFGDAEMALGGLGADGRSVASIAAAFIDYQKNWNATLAARLGPPIISIPGGVHPNASFGSITGSGHWIDWPIATVAAVQIPQVSCCATSPALSNKDSYPFFLRTVPPDGIQALALWNWIRHFEVPIAACLYSAEAYGQGLFDALKELARSDGQQDSVQGQALRDMEQDFVAEEARASVRLLKQIGSRFVVLLITWHLAAPLLDVLEEEEILSPAWQLLASETMADPIVPKNQLGFMYFLPSGKGVKFPDLQRLWSLLGPQDIYGTEQMEVPVGIIDSEVFTAGVASNLSPFDAFNFDAVYTFIVAINRLLAASDPFAIKGQSLLEEMRRVRFTGVSGEVSFNENGDRFGTYELMNILSDGSAIAIASFNSFTSTFTFQAQPTWMDGSLRSLPPPELYSCDPGFYREQTSTQCRKCLKGTMCLGGPMAPYKPCPRGTFASEIGMSNCTPCPKGSFALDAGSVECTPCPPGTEGPLEGMETCTRCSSGFYTPWVGSSQCFPCGKGQITPESGSTAESDCLCAEHYFMCEGRGCLPCPAGLHCVQGLGPPQQQGGFWADPNVSRCDFSVLRCRDHLECPSGLLGGCSAGREGPACNNCQASHYPNGSVCEHCQEGDVLPLILLIMLFLGGLFFMSRLRWDPSHVSCQLGPAQDARAAQARQHRHEPVRVIGFVAQPVAVLVLATYIIYTYPSHIASGRGLHFAARYRFLLHRFKPEAYYYGLVLLYRNAFVALLPTLLVGVPELQVPVMGIILVAVQNLQVYARPWRTDVANLVDMLFTDLLLVFLLSAGPLLVTDKTTSGAVLGWLLCLPVLAVMLVAVLAFATFVVKHLRPNDKLYGIFLCHHKGGAGSLSRLIKILIAQHSSTRVFLDSDQLENLDLLFDIVRTSVKNLVVVLTPELCQGAGAQKQIPELWTPHQKAELSRLGVEIEDLNAAYAWLQHELTPLKMARYGPVSDREAVVVELLSLCGLSARRQSEKANERRPRILIISSLIEPEFLSACEVFQYLLQTELSVECLVVDGINQMATCRPFAYYLVVLLFRGIFRDMDFTKLLMHAAYSAPMQRCLDMVPVIADSNFDFPSIDTLLKRHPISAPFPGGHAHAEQVLRGLRTVLALPFAPLSSAGLRQRQVAEIASRMHRYQDTWHGGLRMIKKALVSNTKSNTICASSPFQPHVHCGTALQDSVAAATQDKSDDLCVDGAAVPSYRDHWDHFVPEADSWDRGRDFRGNG
eukprot:symbB.v1.2.028858.t1/scaffold3096.1/size63706/2